MLVAVFGAMVLGVILFFSKEGPGEVGARFMDALARGNVDKLTAESFAPGKSQAKLRKDWEYATKVGKHYLFFWTITSAIEQTADSAVVRLQVQRNLGPGSYDENYQLPLAKDKDGRWKVDATGISREMYPALPRPGRDADAGDKKSSS